MKNTIQPAAPNELYRFLTPYAGYYNLCRIIFNDGTIHVQEFTENCLHPLIHFASKGKGRLKLRPLTSMTPEEALDLIKTAAPDAYGNYRYKKWEANLDEKNDRNWTAYLVKRPDKGDGRVFVIDLINGRIVLYDCKTQDDGALTTYYFGWYYERGFDIPTYPSGKTLKELNLAYYE